MRISAARTGALFVILEDEIVPITPEFTTDLVYLETQYPGLLETAQMTVRLGIHELAGIEPSLPDAEWHARFSELLTLGAYTVPLNALHEATHQLEAIKELHDEQR